MKKDEIIKCSCSGLKTFYDAPISCSCRCKGCKRTQGCVKDAIKGLHCSDCKK